MTLAAPEMTILKKLKHITIFGVLYTVVSFSLLFGGLTLLPGFPFLPKNVFETSNETAETQLPKGSYHFLFFTRQKDKLPVSHGDTGTIEATALGKDDASTPLPLESANYYFSEGGNRIQGHCVAKFELTQPTRIQLKTHFKSFNYDGLIVRTPFTPFLLTIACFEIVAIGISFLLTIAVSKLSTH